ncbi:ras-like protein family member 10B isoform X2 [Atheta coriaria]|uniref:ras-like protein family member 10B isoform X2 n=1 Tax=Dalotia coriaria TaxID=877792 RepID=UPI0031F4680E
MGRFKKNSRTKPKQKETLNYIASYEGTETNPSTSSPESFEEENSNVWNEVLLRLRDYWTKSSSPIQSSSSFCSNHSAVSENCDRQELDLDFLEKRHHANGEASEKRPGNDALRPQDPLQSPLEFSPESVDRVKVIFLGPPAVGKTSIVQQFVWNSFCDEYQPTDLNSYYEWTDYRFYGLRSASAYVLVFDLANLETFQYVKTLREQICESRNMSNVPILVIGNKLDLISGEDGAASTSASSKAITGGDAEKRRDIANLVRKHWKCGYMECSAKYNWKLVAAFRELMGMVDSIDVREQSPMLDNLQDALDRNKCAIL